MKKRATKKYIHEGRYVAEVSVELLDEDHEWAPYLSASDARKLDAVRAALKVGDLASAARLSTLYEMKPVAAE